MFSFADMPITMNGLLSVLYALVAVMILVVLYHLLFIVVDLRKIMKRFEDTTAQVEALILKPISILDEAFQWVMDYMSQNAKKKHGHKGKHKEKMDEKPFDVEAI